MLAAIIWEGKFHPYRLVEMVTMLGCAFSLVIWRRNSPLFFSKLSRSLLKNLGNLSFFRLGGTVIRCQVLCSLA